MDPHDELLRSIREGKSLKKVNNADEKPAVVTNIEEPGSDDLAEALKKILIARKGKFRGSSESEEEAPENAYDSEDWE